MLLPVDDLDDLDALVRTLVDHGAARNVPLAVALAVAPDGSDAALGLALEGPAGAATAVASVAGRVEHVVGAVAAVEGAIRPRWVWWRRDPAAVLVAHGVRLGACWDLSAVHRVIHGGWRVDEVRIWCVVEGLDRHDAPVLGQLDLGSGDAGEGFHPAVRADGHLRAEWVEGSWRDDAEAAGRWAELALHVQARQATALAAIDAAGDPPTLARSESAAEILCAELEHDGLPIDLDVADALITSMAGPRPASEAEANQRRAERDAEVLRHLPAGGSVDLRNPADVKGMLRRVGIDVPDTRAWRLEAMRDAHPVVDALLQWRKAERIATTFGHSWLDQHVGADGRLRGAWSSTDGAAGRMTAQAGLHNLPAELRPAVRADPGWVFVQADLGQIEPRVLAAVSGDRGLIQATTADDLYRPVADRLRVERPIAKVAVLAAMYGQTSGTAGQALQGMERAYPVAMQYLKDADRAGREGRELRTFGGRLIPMYETVAERDRDPDDAVDDRSVSAALAARGRYARNATVQGAAAELFKAWAATVRARVADTPARIVLCLHDELILHVPEADAERVAATVTACLDEASGRWFRGSGVRFVTDVQVVQSWADAKG